MSSSAIQVVLLYSSARGREMGFCSERSLVLCHWSPWKSDFEKCDGVFGDVHDVQHIFVAASTICLFTVLTRNILFLPSVTFLCRLEWNQHVSMLAFVRRPSQSWKNSHQSTVWHEQPNTSRSLLLHLELIFPSFSELPIMHHGVPGLQCLTLSRRLFVFECFQ